MGSEEGKPADSGPWWKFGHVWLIIAGPAVVVVAAFVTLYLAIRTPDPVVADDQYRRGQPTAPRQDKSMAPAVQGRNHAVTPAGN